MKVPLRNGNGQQFKYVEPSAGPAYTSRLHRVVAELVETVRGSGNLIVLRTPPGSAMMLASAVDAAEWPEVFGTIAGDDTVFVAIEKSDKLTMLMQRFLDMKGEQ